MASDKCHSQTAIVVCKSLCFKEENTGNSLGSWKSFQEPVNSVKKKLPMRSIYTALLKLMIISCSANALQNRSKIFGVQDARSKFGFDSRVKRPEGNRSLEMRSQINFTNLFLGLKHFETFVLMEL